MMCEDCGIRSAKFHLVTIINGDRVERNLCPACMAKHQKQIPGIDFSNLAGILNSILENKDSQEQARQEAELEGYVCEVPSVIQRLQISVIVYARQQDKREY